MEAKLRSFGASRKDVHKINSKGMQNFFQKACRWQKEKIENNLFQQIEEEDIKLNKNLYAQRMTTSNGMYKI